MAKPSIYDLLSKQGIEDTTTAQLNTATSSSVVDATSVEFWKGPITLQRVLQVRTYPWGLPIPEAGAVGVTDDIAASGTGVIQPPGTELWQITGMMGVGIGGSAVIDLMWFDGSNNVIMVSQQTITTGGTMIDINEKVSAPFILSNSLYLAITSASFAVQIKYAYHKVSL